MHRKRLVITNTSVYAVRAKTLLVFWDSAALSLSLALSLSRPHTHLLCILLISPAVYIIYHPSPLSRGWIAFVCAFLPAFVFYLPDLCLFHRLMTLCLNLTWICLDWFPGWCLFAFWEMLKEIFFLTFYLKPDCLRWHFIWVHYRKACVIRRVTYNKWMGSQPHLSERYTRQSCSFVLLNSSSGVLVFWVPGTLPQRRGFAFN